MTTFVFSTEVPNVKPSSSSWELVTNTRTFQSPLTGAVQTAARKGSHWKISLTFENLFGENRANMQAFLASLEGQEHRFTIEDHSFSRRGTGVDTGLVTAASSGNTLNVTRTLSSALTIEKGDYLSANDQLFMATAKVNGTTATSFAITVSPLVRSSSTGEVVELDTPKGTFILTSSTGWDTKPGIFSSFKIEAIEDVLA
tara:strand:+ start:370 stop:969 length:600 start_codon:yes stop_codon:yes gene_type:complete